MQLVEPAPEFDGSSAKIVYFVTLPQYSQGLQRRISKTSDAGVPERPKSIPSPHWGGWTRSIVS
jgi:hypothetical protein